MYMYMCMYGYPADRLLLLLLTLSESFVHYYSILALGVRNRASTARIHCIQLPVVACRVAVHMSSAYIHLIFHMTSLDFRFTTHYLGLTRKPDIWSDLNISAYVQCTFISAGIFVD